MALNWIGPFLSQLRDVENRECNDGNYQGGGHVNSFFFPEARWCGWSGEVAGRLQECSGLSKVVRVRFQFSVEAFSHGKSCFVVAHDRGCYAWVTISIEKLFDD